MAGNPLPRSRIGSDRWSGRGFAVAVAAGGGGLAMSPAAAAVAVAAGGGGLAMSPAAAAVAVAAGGSGLPGRLPADTGGLRALSCPLQRARRRRRRRMCDRQPMRLWRGWAACNRVCQGASDRVGGSQRDNGRSRGEGDLCQQRSLGRRRRRRDPGAAAGGGGGGGGGGGRNGGRRAEAGDR